MDYEVERARIEPETLVRRPLETSEISWGLGDAKELGYLLTDGGEPLKGLV
jgi:hypothetical protein